MGSQLLQLRPKTSPIILRGCRSISHEFTEGNHRAVVRSGSTHARQPHVRRRSAQLCRKNFPFGNFCLVRDWLWLDIDTTDAQRQALEKTQRQPALIYAHQVVFDSERRWDVGDFVRTSLLHQFNEDFHFRTLNSVYLLLGPGTRKLASSDTIACLI